MGDRLALPDLLFVMLMVLIVFLPSGFVYGIPVKHISLLLIAFIYLATGLKNFSFFVKFSGFWFVLLFPFFLLGFGYFKVYSAREFQMVLLPLVLSGLFISYFGVKAPRFLIVLIFSSSFLVFILKLGIVSLVYFDFYSMDGVVEFYRDIFYTDFVSMEIYPSVIRVFGAYDPFVAFVPIILVSLYSLKLCRLSSIQIYGLLLISMFVVFFSYSRFLWFIYVLGFFIFLFYIPGDVKKLFLVVSILFLCIVFGIFGIDLVVERFSNRHNVSSDSIRIDQFYCLLRFWAESPYTGFGLGAYSPGCIRSLDEPYSYELQLVSFLPKFGLSFFLLVSAYFGYLIFQFMEKGAVWGLLLFLVFLTGLTNPFLFNTAFSPVYILVIFASSKFYSDFRNVCNSS